jgi:hypothetical protein
MGVLWYNYYMKTKRCPQCNKELPLSDFSIDKTRLSGLSCYCRKCKAAYMRRYREENPEKIKEIEKRRYEKTKDKIIKRGKRYRTKNYADIRNGRYKKKYGITYDEKLEILEKVGYKCAICQDSVTVENSQLDHNHETGDVRGILCINCNLMLGHSKDNADILKRAVQYLDGGVA